MGATSPTAVQSANRSVRRYRSGARCQSRNSRERGGSQIVGSPINVTVVTFIHNDQSTNSTGQGEYNCWWRRFTSGEVSASFFSERRIASSGVSCRLFSSIPLQSGNSKSDDKCSACSEVIVQIPQSFSPPIVVPDCHDVS